MAIGMPGWPQFAAWTASIDRARIASTQRRSRSGGAVVEGGAGAVATGGGGFMRLSCRRRRTRDTDYGELGNAVFAPSDNCSTRAVLTRHLTMRIADPRGRDQAGREGESRREKDRHAQGVDRRVVEGVAELGSLAPDHRTGDVGG